MERLSSMDAAFLEIEKSGPSVAVGSAMMVYGKAPSLAKLHAYFEERIRTCRGSDRRWSRAARRFGRQSGSTMFPTSSTTSKRSS